MTPDSSPADFGETHPGLALLRMATLLAEAPGAHEDAEAMALLSSQVAAGVLDKVAPETLWPELRRGLMGAAPARMIGFLRDCGALQAILPEVAALSGVPQIADGHVDVDLGAHLLHALEEAAAIHAPLEARFALLVMNVGKSDSPREHLPTHYRHVERGAPRIEAIAARFCVPPKCRDLALLALAECERVHRASKVRAGPVAAMLERLGAFDAPERYRKLMSVCACDFRAYEGRSGQLYPKAALLDLAIAACADVATDADASSVQTARAQAIATAFRSARWSEKTA